MAGLVALKKAPPNKPPSTRELRVNVFRAEEYKEKLGIEVSGSVVAFREIKISAEVAGPISKKNCQAGQYVSADQILFEIDSTDYDLELDRIKAEVEQAEKSIQETQQEIAGAETSFKLAEKDFKIQKAEYERRMRLGSNVLSDSEMAAASKSFIASEQAFNQSSNNLKLLKKRKERLAQAKLLSEAMQRKAEKNVERCIVRSEVNGVIVNDLVEKGDFVQRGTQLALFEDISKSEVQSNLRPDQIQWLWENSSNPANRSTENPYELPPTTLTVHSDFGGESVSWPGRLESFDGFGLDERTKMVPCRVVIDNPIAKTEAGNRALIRNMYVQVRIEIDPQMMSAAGHQFVKIPAIALRPGNYVWVIRDGKLDRLQVRVADRIIGDAKKDRFDNYVVIKIRKNGLVPNEKIVITPMAQPEIGGAVVENESS